MEKFYKDKEQYIKESGDEHACKYECMECGCIFYGRWHSEYSISKVKCPTCETSGTPFITIKEMS